MANITGTNGNDILTGTEQGDTIQGLAGNDRIISSRGSDIIDGGAGNDTVDYTNSLSQAIGIAFNAADLSPKIAETGEATVDSFDQISNVETIIGKAQVRNYITVDSVGTSIPLQLDVDLAANRLTYISKENGTRKTLIVKNFTDIDGGSQDDILKGSDQDNSIDGRTGRDVIIGSKGNDSLIAETIDYSKIGNAINVLAKLTFVSASGRNPIDSIVSQIAVEKGGVGKDNIFGTEKIIGAVNKENTLDVSSSERTSVNINLSTNLLNASEDSKGPNIATSLRKIEIVNFTNAIGTNNSDIIVGSNKKGKLTGGGGSDTITGGNKNDIITGSDSTAKGVGEVDILTGGGGRDKFVLGNANGAYYVGNKSNDFATITDFNLFQDSIDLGGFQDYSFASAGNNTIELYSGKDVNTRDLIAKIQLTGGISPMSSNSRSAMGASSNIDAIVGKIDILSGTNANV
jgi:Ca2+-binding RTX toxin-like protein